ncbi:helix-turn-helix transcriptional regulator [Spirillospora sp. NPDC047279]|uniref:helix-turn-helix domain-containing protein n=1 Tax=Spirillospora sp. NPDC047279 TaxID=3155478 RepID=UPI0033F8A698
MQHTDLGSGLGEVARRRRKALGLTQGRLAELTGLSQPAISRFEAAGPLPPIPALERIGEVLGLRLILTFEPRTPNDRGERERRPH